MPELPEVETVVNSLRPQLVGRKVVDINVLLPKMIKLCQVEELGDRVIGQELTDIFRRGKYFIIVTANDWWIVGHLRMTGRLTVSPQEAPADKYTHVIFQLDNGTQLRFADMRQFGCLYLVRPGEVEQIHGLATLGPEPLDPQLTVAQFAKGFVNRRVKVKQLLLNQQFVAGIGNIYADEILYAAGINPNRLANSLSQEEIGRVFSSMVTILTAGVKFRGTSIKDYVDGFGVKGEFQNYLKVYGRTGQECLECNTSLTKDKIGGRSTHFCPNCQQ